MTWPTSTDYYAAVQHLRVSAGDEELRGGEAARTPRRKLLVWTGNFADVYRIDCPATGNSWALKCFTREVPGLEDRYRLIASHLAQAGLPFTVDFQWLEQGLRIHGQWFPALKMRWVEGLTLTQYVEKYLEQPQNLRLLLSPWVKLATMLREAQIAHADLQHGNVLLVPTGDALALRLIDYDGMWVPALANSRSGEVGHPAYQHPQRLREGTYNSHVDRFSHLAIYTAVRCLMVGRSELWRQFSNGDNLLFREQDFRNPESSPLFHAVWQLDNMEVRPLVGRLILACAQRLEEVPWIDDLVSNGQACPLTGEAEEAVGEVLAAGEAARESDGGRAGSAVTPPPLPNSARSRESLLQRLRRGLFMPARGVDSALGKLAGEGNDLLHNFFRLGTVLVLVACIAWALMLGAGGGGMVFFLGQKQDVANLDGPPGAQSSSDGPESPREPEKPPQPTLPTANALRLKPIAAQTVEAGKFLGVEVSVEDAEQWKGKLRFNLGPNSPAGAEITAETGRFQWTPPQSQPPGGYDVRLMVEGPEGQRDQTSFAVTVSRVTPVPLYLRAIGPQTVEAGKQLTVAVMVQDAEQSQGKLRFSLGPKPPPGARIDPEEGLFTWTPNADEPAGKHDATVSVEGLDKRGGRMTFTITVTRPAKQMTVDLGRGITMEMLLIPAGSFMMGDDSGKPAHEVNITKPFYLGKYEVTQEQWQAIMSYNPSKFKGPKNPVEQVCWSDCQAFLAKLNKKYGRKGKFGLPTEAQWEYACRAGSTTRYSFGDDEESLGDYAWHDANSGNKTHPVGEKKPNAWGLYDMHGNVWEWCADWFDKSYYAKPAMDDPAGPAAGSDRVVRGGSYFCPARDCPSADRQWSGPLGRPEGLGLRVSRVSVEERRVRQEPQEPLHLEPIALQTVEAGDRLAVTLLVEDAEELKGKLRFSLGPNLPTGARLDAETGEFTWTPAKDQPAGTHDVVVSVEGPEGRTGRTNFAITVTRPTPPSPKEIMVTESPRSAAKEIAVDLGGGVKLELVRIPAGEFMMGDERGGDSEKPIHRVRITKPFYLGKYEVTQEQWQAVMGNNPSSFWGRKNPVEQVSWDDCQAFLGKLNEKYGSRGKFSLPTEAQWEYACRAASTTQWCFGDDDSQLGEYAWYDGNSSRGRTRPAGEKNHTSPVGSKKPNTWDLYDMHGNVWEWCADWYDPGYYLKSPADDPVGPEGGSFRVRRGGSSHGTGGLCRSALRSNLVPGYRFGGLGLRVSRSSADGLPLVREPIQLKPVGLQTAVVGKELAVNISVDNAEHSQGKLEFKLASESTPSASVDPKTGQFLWTPSVNEPAGKHEVTVSVEGPEGRTSQVPFSIAVIRRAPHAEPSVPRAKEIKVELGGGAAMEMLLIPVGSFVMGDDNGENREKPAHKVFMTQPFYLGKHEVTQEQWQAIMGDNPSEFKEPKNPVEGVSWNDCQSFLRKLNKKLCPDEAKFGLPTEAQWEYACRAGGTSRYHFGNDEKSLDEYAWYADNAGGRTHSIGQKKPNAWGLYDMHGNVGEWCEDRYGEDYYTTSPRDDPAGPIDGSFRVLRGGAWDRYSWHCRAGARHVIAPGVKDMRMGFRVFRVGPE